MLLVGTAFALFAAVLSRLAVAAADVPAVSTNISEDVVAPSASPVTRTVFRHSVVPGGVYNAGEVQSAVNRDSTVAAHYGHVTPGALHPEKLEADQLVYMSYRIGDEIYWTRHPVRLRQGEMILSDGVNRIRARCGNCLSLQPMQPTTDGEPDSKEFDAPADAEPEILPSRVVLSAATSMPVGEIAPGMLSSFPSSGGLFMPVDAGNTSGPGSLAGPLSDLTYGDTLRSGLGIFRDFPPGPSGTGLPPLIGSPTFPAGQPGDFASEGNHLVLEDPFLYPTENPVPVPEPSTLLLLGGGISVLLARRRCR